MAGLTSPQRKLLRRLASHNSSVADDHDIRFLLQMVIASDEAVQQALEVIAGARKIMLNRRVDLTDEEEMFLMDHGVPPDDHGLCRPFEGYPRVMDFAEMDEFLAEPMEHPADRCLAAVTSPSDLVMLVRLCKSFGE